MQTLVFNTTERTVEVLNENADILYRYSNVPTVKVMDGFYEVIQEEKLIKYPVLRVPIANTNMTIIK